MNSTFDFDWRAASVRAATASGNFLGATNGDADLISLFRNLRAGNGGSTAAATTNSNNPALDETRKDAAARFEPGIPTVANKRGAKHISCAKSVRSGVTTNDAPSAASTASFDSSTSSQFAFGSTDSPAAQSGLAGARHGNFSMNNPGSDSNGKGSNGSNRTTHSVTETPSAKFTFGASAAAATLAASSPGNFVQTPFGVIPTYASMPAEITSKATFVFSATAETPASKSDWRDATKAAPAPPPAGAPFQFTAATNATNINNSAPSGRTASSFVNTPFGVAAPSGVLGVGAPFPSSPAATEARYNPSTAMPAAVGFTSNDSNAAPSTPAFQFSATATAWSRTSFSAPGADAPPTRVQSSSSTPKPELEPATSFVSTPFGVAPASFGTFDPATFQSADRLSSTSISDRFATPVVFSASKLAADSSPPLATPAFQFPTTASTSATAPNLKTPGAKIGTSSGFVHTPFGAQVAPASTSATPSFVQTPFGAVPASIKATPGFVQTPFGVILASASATPPALASHAAAATAAAATTAAATPGGPSAPPTPFVFSGITGAPCVSPGLFQTATASRSSTSPATSTSSAGAKPTREEFVPTPFGLAPAGFTPVPSSSVPAPAAVSAPAFSVFSFTAPSFGSGDSRSRSGGGSGGFGAGVSAPSFVFNASSASSASAMNSAPSFVFNASSPSSSTMDETPPSAFEDLIPQSVRNAVAADVRRRAAKAECSRAELQRTLLESRSPSPSDADDDAAAASGLTAASIAAAVEASRSMLKETFVKAATSMYATGDYLGSCREYSNAIQLDPDDAMLPSNRAAAHLKLGDYESALADCGASLRLKPDCAPSHRRRIQCFLGRGLLDRALNAAEEALGALSSWAHAANAKEVRADAARIHAFLDEELKAKARLKAGVVGATTLATAEAAREAISILDAAQAAAPECAGSWTARALRFRALLALRRFPDILDVARGCLPNMLRRGSEGLLGRLPCLTVMSGSVFVVDACAPPSPAPAWIAAVGCAVACAAWSTRDANTALALCLAVQALDEDNAAAGTLKTAIRAVEHARLRGNEAHREGRYGAAVAAYGDAIRILPPEVGSTARALLFSNRAASNVACGELEDALLDCNAALAEDPGFWKARLRRARVYVKLKRYAKAQEDFRALQREGATQMTATARGRPVDVPGSLAAAMSEIAAELRGAVAAAEAERRAEVEAERRAREAEARRRRAAAAAAAAARASWQQRSRYTPWWQDGADDDDDEEEEDYEPDEEPAPRGRPSAKPSHPPPRRAPSPPPPFHYVVLNITALEVKGKDGADALKRAYRAASLMHHPDKCASPGAADRMKAINVAFETLADAVKRREHDDAVRAYTMKHGMPAYTAAQEKAKAAMRAADAAEAKTRQSR